MIPAYHTPAGNTTINVCNSLRFKEDNYIGAAGLFVLRYDYNNNCHIITLYDYILSSTGEILP